MVLPSSGSFSGLGEEAVKQPLASLRKLQVLSDQLYKLDRSTERLRMILPVNELAHR